MEGFAYATPKSREEVVRLLGAEEGAAILAGGTDLLSLMKDYVVSPRLLVSLRAVAGLAGIEVGDEEVRIGAMTRLADLVEDTTVRGELPALLQAAEGIRSPQMLDMGTVGGELCQRPRCWYYRAGFGLLAQRDGQSMVTAGDNRYHAILGNQGPAYFVNPSSLAPPLIALGAKVRLLGRAGEREIAVEELFRIPRVEGERELTIGDDELLTEIVVPRRGLRSATYEIRPRLALDWPLAAAAVAVALDGSTVSEARVVLGHVAPVPWPASAAGERLRGRELSEAAAEEAAESAVSGARPLSRNAYKVQLARAAVRRAVLRLAGVEV